LQRAFKISGSDWLDFAFSRILNSLLCAKNPLDLSEKVAQSKQLCKAQNLLIYSTATAPLISANQRVKEILLQCSTRLLKPSINNGIIGHEGTPHSVLSSASPRSQRPTCVAAVCSILAENLLGCKMHEMLRLWAMRQTCMPKSNEARLDISHAERNCKGGTSTDGGRSAAMLNMTTSFCVRLTTRISTPVSVLLCHPLSLCHKKSAFGKSPQSRLHEGAFWLCSAQFGSGESVLCSHMAIYYGVVDVIASCVLDQVRLFLVPTFIAHTSRTLAMEKEADELL
jgi:hypothetical protein